MTVVYELRGYFTRQWISLGVVVAVTGYGLLEIWRGVTGSDPGGYIFGPMFIAGAAYGLFQIVRDARDQAGRLEVADDGAVTATLWRPTGLVRVTAGNGPANWRYYVKIAGRGLQRPFLFATFPDRKEPVQMEMRADVVVTDGLRALAPEAVGELEAARAAGAARMAEATAARKRK